jgi:hypothetical protein
MRPAWAALLGFPSEHQLPHQQAQQQDCAQPGHGYLQDFDE